MEHFDVFLSYKQTDEFGNITPEVALAEKLYSLLNEHNISTFYSKKTIGLLGDAQYKSVIDDALDTATVLVAIGTSLNNLNSNWVHYEWDSFYNDILSGRKNGQVISWTYGISINELPRTLRQLQTFDKGIDNIDSLFEFIVRALKSKKNKIALNENKPRIVSLKELAKLGLSPLDIAIAITENDKYLYNSLPESTAGTPQQWADFFERYPDFCAFIIDSQNNILGNYSFIGLTTEQEKLMRSGKLLDSSLNASVGDNLYVPGKHIGYLMNLSVNPMAESIELYKALWNSFTDMLKSIAENDSIYFSKIYYKAFLPEHEVKVAAKGFHILCDDILYGKVFVHDMDLNGSLQALDPNLAGIYLENKKLDNKKTNELQIKNDTNVLSTYMSFWSQIEELFYHPKYYRLKRYFVGDDKLPKNSAEYQLGLVIAMWLRDIMQYSSVLLSFLPQEQQETYYQYESTLLNSGLIKESIKEYRFSTEGKKLSVDIKGDKAISIDSLKIFANIWLDIGKLFMNSDLIDLRPYFYNKKSEMPSDDNLELCEGIAVRILTAMHLSEGLLFNLPDELVDSYFDYKDEMLQSEIIEHTFRKYPFIKRELTGEY